MLWQSDNREFDGYMAWESDFKAWYELPAPQTNRSTPLYIWRHASLAADSADRSTEIKKWYTVAGYMQVDLQAVDAADENQLDDRLVNTLLGVSSATQKIDAEGSWPR